MTDEPPKHDEPTGEPAPENVEKLSNYRRRRPSRMVNVTNDEPAVAARLAKVRMLIGDAPYEPVGFDGARYWVLDSERHLRDAAPRDIGGAFLDSICGAHPYLRERYPRMRNGKPVEGFVADRARRELMNACHLMGHWEPSNVRSVGAWPGADGDLILHRGDHLYINHQVRPLGRVGDFVYVPGPPLPMLPNLEKLKGRGAAVELLDRLDTFSFARGSFDALMMLGVICICMVAGALKFRPHVFITGELDTGKTTLQHFIRAVLGANGIVDITDATAAGIWQALHSRSVPIGYDEFEAEADPKRQDKIIALARQASTGGMLRRGSGGHLASQFPIVSNFICSSIIPPPFNGADASRFLVIAMLKLAYSRKPFSLDMLGTWGLELTATLAARWRLLHDKVLPELRALMQGEGYPGRVIDLYGLLIGLVSVALHDDVEKMKLSERLASFQMKRLLAEAVEEQQAEWRRCLDHMLSHRIDKHRSTSAQLGEQIAEAAAPLMNPATRMQANLLGEDDDVSDGEQPNKAIAARRQLQAYGLRVVAMAEDNGSANVVLQVAHQNRQLAEVFAETRWRTTAESATGGGWTQALKRTPGAMIGRNRFRGVLSRCVCVPIAMVLQPGTAPQQGTVKREDDDDVAGAGLLH